MKIFRKDSSILINGGFHYGWEINDSYTKKHFPNKKAYCIDSVDINNDYDQIKKDLDAVGADYKIRRSRLNNSAYFVFDVTNWEVVEN